MKPQRLIGWIVALALVAAAPNLLGIVKTGMAINLVIFITFAVSLNLLLSYTGLLSFGHAVFFGTGAYATAILLSHFEKLSLGSTVIGSGLAAGLVALLLSPMLVRVRDTAFAMLTLAFGQLMFVLCLKLRELTGGEDGIAAFPVPPLILPMGVSLDLTNHLTFYYFAMLTLGACVGLMWFITRTPFGSLMIGIRDNENRMAFLGYNVAATKALVFVISGAFAGIAGSLFALYQNVVSATGVFHQMVSFTPLIAILIGGIGTFSGPFVGMSILLLLQQAAARFTTHVELVTGIVFIVFVLFLPGGVAWYWQLLKHLQPRRRQRRASGASAE